MVLAAVTRSKRRKRNGSGLLIFSLPAVVWFATFMIYPLFSMLYLSLTDWRSLISSQSFVGFAQYAKVFADPIFWSAFQNTLLQLVIAVPTMTFLGFMLAYYLTLKPVGVTLLRIVCFTPALMSLSAKSIMFFGAFAPDGLINGLLRSVGLDSLTNAWLASESTALYSIIAIDIWSGIGFTAVLLAVRMSGISPEIFEAAEIDGAGHWRKMWRISFPVSKDYFGGLFMLQFLWTAFNSAALILLLTRGGPGTSTYTLSYLMYSKAFVGQSIGYSQVVGVSLFVLGLFGMWAIRRTFRSVV
jgi:multiple sugar transport system permease protein